MMHTIDGTQFKQMILHGAAAITLQKQQINDLNVFPVPDGDTGTNMSLTIGAASAELKKSGDSAIGQAAAITAGALLRGARGNSGVILSLLFRGLSKTLKGHDTADGALLAAAMQEGVASGPMTATFLLPFAMGACDAAGGNLMTDAFGLVALVAMTPLVTIQLMGLAGRMRRKLAVQAVRAEIAKADDCVLYYD